MKKIMTLLMVSVFFLVGGRTEGTTQKEGKNISEDAIVSPEYVNARVGDFLQIPFVMEGIAKDWQYLVLMFHRPGDIIQNFLVLYRDGRVVYSAGCSEVKFYIYSDQSKTKVYLLIYSIIPADQGVYYLAAKVGDRMIYSSGTRLSTDY